MRKPTKLKSTRATECIVTQPPYRIVFTRRERSLLPAVTIVGSDVSAVTEENFWNALNNGFDTFLGDLLKDKDADPKCLLFAAHAGAGLAKELGIPLDEEECLRILTFSANMFLTFESSIITGRMKELAESMTRLDLLSSYVHEFINLGMVNETLLTNVEGAYKKNT